MVLIALFLGVYSLYALKSYGKGAVAWPFEGWESYDDGLILPKTYDHVLLPIFNFFFAPFSWIFDPDALADIRKPTARGFQQGYLYSLLYTVVMIAFGYQALLRWTRKAKRPSYQKWRYITLITFQVVFFFIANVIAVKAMSVQHAWRAWGLYQPFPLFFNTFFWWDDDSPTFLFWFFVGAGLIGTLVVIPVLSRNHGKRFCTWVCGCGGLAETLGDRWRHLAAKGERSRAWEFQAAVVLLASVIVCLVVVGSYGSFGNDNGSLWPAYNLIVDFWLVAVIPIALYPFFGGKVWCRYWCPLAAFTVTVGVKAISP